jgi:tRNA-binding EMAP/Myf-like protein
MVSFEGFEKLDIRVGTITAVVEIANSRKLMKLSVSFGDHSRKILAGIKRERENPLEIVAFEVVTASGFFMFPSTVRPQPGFRVVNDVLLQAFGVHFGQFIFCKSLRVFNQ